MLHFSHHSGWVAGMTQFGQALSALLDRRGASLREIEARTDIDHTTLSRLIKDQRPSRSQLAVLCAKACDDDSERHQLVYAHLSDEITGAGLEAQRFSLRYSDALEIPARESLPPDLEAAVAVLVPAARANPTLRALFNDLAALVLQNSEPTSAPALLAVAEKSARYHSTAKKRSIRRPARPS